MRGLSRCLLAAALLGASLAACRENAPPPAVQPGQPAPTASVVASAPAPASASPAATAAPAPPATVPANVTLLVGGDGGIEEIGLDGNPRRSLTRTPASHPRLAPGGGVLFVTPDKPELRLVSADGREEVVAQFPLRKGCDPANPRLSVQEDNDFVVDAGRKMACLRLMDRNANMVSTAIVARVDLIKRQARTAVWIAPSCRAEKNAETLFDCDRNTPPHHHGLPPRAPADQAGVPAGYTEESRSPSGRWAVVTGNLQEGDYIHRDLYLLDTGSARIHPVQRGNWPAPISIPKPPTPGATVDVVGESTIRWLGVGDLLLVDRLLITPGERVIELRGDVAY